MNKDRLYELGLPGLVLALVLFFVLVVAATAGSTVFPVTQENCGSFGNVLAAVQHMRNEGMDIDKVRGFLKQSLDECIAANGKENCILTDKDGQIMFDAMLEQIWKLPPTDPIDFGFQAYQECLRVNKGRVM